MFWNTTGNKYATQVVIEENHGVAGTGRVPLDFIIELVGSITNTPPTCTGASGTIQTAAGVPVNLTLTGIDSEGGNLTVNHQGLPPGATLTPVTDTSSNSPFAVQFSWTPSLAQSGQSFPVLVLFTDNGGLQAQCSFAITVNNEAADFELISSNVGNAGSGDGPSSNPALSADGSLVAFSSAASDLVSGDNNGLIDVFVRDRISRTTELVSVDTGGSSGNGDSYNPVISADGRYVVFQSRASDLVAGDNNNAFDVFVRDRTLGQTFLVSMDSSGSAAAGNSYSPQLTADGRKIVFASTADDLVNNDTNNTADAFIRDLDANTTTLLSVSSNGWSGNAISAPPVITPDGRYVAFLSAANDLTPGDTNVHNDVYRRDLMSGTTLLASRSTNGQAGNFTSFHPVISTNGQRVAFASQATDLTPDADGNMSTDVFIFDFGTNQTLLVSRVPGANRAGDKGSATPFFSSDGNHLLFITIATDLAANDTNGKQDVFLWRGSTDTLELISVNRTGSGPGNDFAGISAAGMSEDLRFVAFYSTATDLSLGGTNAVSDIYLRDRMAGQTILMSRPAGHPFSGNGANFSPFISANGAAIVYSSDASNLTPNDSNNASDIFAIHTTNSLPGLQADLAVTVTPTMIDDASVGSNLQYVVTVTNNNGNSTLSFSVAAQLSKLAVASATPSKGTFDTNTLSWTLPSLAGNTSATLTLDVVPNNVGWSSNWFNLVSVGSFDTNVANNGDSFFATIRHVGVVSFAGPTAPASLMPPSSAHSFIESFESNVISGVSITGGAIQEPGPTSDAIAFSMGAVMEPNTNGHVVHVSNASSGVTFGFDQNVLGALPTDVGLYWTDGNGQGIGFEAFGPNGNSLGNFGNFNTTINTNEGATSEDRFFGVTNATGISSVRMTSLSSAMEVDHLQFTLQPGAPLPSGLVLWLTGSETNSVASTNVAQLVNGANFGTGLVGNAFQFDGIDDFVQIANTATSLPPLFTVEFWFNSASNLNVGSPFTPLVIMLEPGDTFDFVAKGFDFYYEQGALKFGLAQTPAPIRSIAAYRNDITGSSWHHVAGSLSNNVQRLYFDGVLVAMATMTGALNYTPAPVLLARTVVDSGFTPGGLQPSGGTFSPVHFGGFLDEFSFYDSVLPSSTIANIHQQADAGKVLPNVSAALNGGTVLISWPSFQPNFDVVGSTNLFSPQSFSTIGIQAIVTNGVIQVAVPPTNGSRFFRLQNTTNSVPPAID
ncbi:MAG: LamG-like jellyroll fold domain-containing protein [Limisphaerales bacterium]